VVVVRSAGLPEQRVWRSTLGGVEAAVAGEALSPVVVVISRVAGEAGGEAGEGGEAQ
jgi:siroheme synthase